MDPRFGPFTLATLYLTHSPCVKCQDVIITEGVVRVVYRVPYRCPDLSKLAAARVEVVHLPEEQQ